MIPERYQHRYWTQEEHDEWVSQHDLEGLLDVERCELGEKGVWTEEIAAEFAELEVLEQKPYRVEDSHLLENALYDIQQLKNQLSSKTQAT